MTKRTHRISLLIVLVITVLGSQSLLAQRRKRAQEKDEKTFASRLWYGGNVGIGFNSGFGSSIFQIGVAPMVGYKIVGPLSVGPRVAFTYASLKEAGFRATSLFNVDAGGFVRCRVFRGLFLQGELSNEWYQEPLGGGERISLQRFNQRIGAGWNFGQPGGVGSEIGVFYNFAIANDIDTYQNPIDYRFGFTWKF
jgi:hypothetical protein